jgi:hypothetical protein
MKLKNPLFLGPGSIKWDSCCILLDSLCFSVLENSPSCFTCAAKFTSLSNLYTSTCFVGINKRLISLTLLLVHIQTPFYYLSRFGHFLAHFPKQTCKNSHLLRPCGFFSVVRKELNTDIYGNLYFGRLPRRC